MNFRKRPSFSTRDLGILSIIGFITIVLGSTILGVNISLSRVIPGGGVFYSGLEGARAFLYEHTAPYSGTAATLAQELAYGRPANQGENPYSLTIPFFLLPVYFPFTLFTDSTIARGMWMFLSEAALAGSVFLSLRIIEWQPRRLFVIFFYLISLVNYYSVTALMDGTPVILLGFLYLCFLYAYKNNRDELAGLFLVPTLIYWQVGGLLLILITWKIFNDKRWRVLFGFAMAFIIIFTISLLIYPGWIFPFTVGTIANIQAQFGITSTAAFSRLFPDSGNRIAQIVTISVSAILIYEWAAARRADHRRFIWAACLTLAATPLIGFRTEIGNLSILFPCLTLLFAATTDRWKTGTWLSSLLLAIVLLVPWAFFVRWWILNEQRYSDYLFLFYPTFSIIGLYWIRWWFIHPPRTWLDQVRSSKTLQPLK